MHNDFADWYRIATIDPKDIELSKRWQGIQAFTKEAEKSDLVNAARLFFSLPISDESFLAKFKSSFKAADETFSMLDNNAELGVLAGASLVNHFEIGDNWNVAAALCITCGAFRGQRHGAVGDIVGLARGFLLQVSGSLRRKTSATLSKIDFTAAITALHKAFAANGDSASLAEPVKTALQTVTASLSELRKWALDQDAERLMRQEESDVLWWLFGSRSRDLDTPLSDVKFPGICLIIAKELADLTRAIPGPFSARAFLGKAIECAAAVKEQTTLADAVAACPKDWISSSFIDLGADNAASALCPTLLAISRSAESDGKKTWHGIFQNISGLSPTTVIPPIDLAHQSYEERLLARVLQSL